jgi:hypothetical protein
MAKKQMPKKEEFCQTDGIVKVSKKSLSLNMSFRDVVKLSAEWDKSKLKNLQWHLITISIISSIADDLGLSNKLLWGVGSKKKSDRLLFPLLCLPIDTTEHKLDLLKDATSKVLADPEFHSYAEEISETAIDFYQNNIVQELHCTLGYFQWECQIKAMQEAINKRGQPAYVSKKMLKRIKDLRLMLTKERLNIRPGRRRNSQTRSIEALGRKEKKAAEQIQQRKHKLIEATATILSTQGPGKLGNNINKTTLAAIMGISRQTVAQWMKSCGYSIPSLEDEAVRKMRCKMKNSP